MTSLKSKYYNNRNERMAAWPDKVSPPHLLFSLASSSAYCLNSSYIFLLKLSLRKKDQNLNRVFIS